MLVQLSCLFAPLVSVPSSASAFATPERMCVRPEIHSQVSIKPTMWRDNCIINVTSLFCFQMREHKCIGTRDPLFHTSDSGAESNRVENVQVSGSANGCVCVGLGTRGPLIIPAPYGCGCACVSDQACQGAGSSTEQGIFISRTGHRLVMAAAKAEPVDNTGVSRHLYCRCCAY